MAESRESRGCVGDGEQYGAEYEAEVMAGK